MLDGNEKSRSSAKGIRWLTPADAREKLDRHLDEFLQKIIQKGISEVKEDPPVLGLQVSAGLGKTLTALKCIAEQGAEILKGGHILFYVPTLDLAEEAHTEFQKFNSGLPSLVLRGRTAINPDTKDPMCTRSKFADEISRSVGSVTAALCQAKNIYGEMIYSDCASKCTYLAQTEERPGSVVFLAHSYLVLQPPLQGDVALRVIDEKFWPSLAETTPILRDHWLSPRGRRANIPKADEPLLKLSNSVRHIVSEALESGEPIHRKLALAGIGKKELKIVGGFETEQLPHLGVFPSMPDETIDLKLQKFDKSIAAQARDQLSVFELLVRTVDQDTTERLSLGKYLRSAPDRVYFNAHLFRSLPKGSPYLFLDADLDETIIRHFCPNAQIVSLHVEPDAEFVQVYDRTLSDYWLVDHANAEDHRDKVLAILQREVASATTNDNGKVLMVATKKVLKALNAHLRSEGDPPQDEDDIPKTLCGADVRWFGPRMLGVNTYKEHATVLIIGRLQLSIGDLENEMRAVFGDGEEPLSFTKGVRFDTANTEEIPIVPNAKPGKLSSLQVHPDPRGMALLKQTREAASEQSIARLRLLLPNRAKRVVVLSKIPLPNLPRGELVRFEDFAEGRSGLQTLSGYRKLEKAVRSPSGEPALGLRTSPKGLFEDAPHAFKSLHGAKDVTSELSKGRVVDALHLLSLENGWDSTEVVLSHIKEGRRRIRAVVFSDEESALQKAEKLWPEYKCTLVGEPVDEKEFSVVDNDVSANFGFTVL